MHCVTRCDVRMGSFKMIVKLLRTFSLFNAVTRDSDQNIFVENFKMMVSYSHDIEKAVIDEHIDGVRVYSGFQRLKRLKAVYATYQQIASFASDVWLFGVPNAVFPKVERMNYGLLYSGDQLTKEWFVIVNHPDHQQALIAEEVSKPNTLLRDRQFKGILTTDPMIVTTLCNHLDDFIRKVSPTWK